MPTSISKANGKIARRIVNSNAIVSRIENENVNVMVILIEIVIESESYDERLAILIENDLAISTLVLRLVQARRALEEHQQPLPGRRCCCCLYHHHQHHRRRHHRDRLRCRSRDRTRPTRLRSRSSHHTDHRSSLRRPASASESYVEHDDYYHSPMPITRLSIVHDKYQKREIERLLRDTACCPH